MSRYAENTTVTVARSREAIERLLRQLGCGGFMWADEIRGQIQLEFYWYHEEEDYLARIQVDLLDGEEPRAQRGKQEHQLLLSWMQATFDAIEAGIVDADVVFLPFLVGTNGQTVAEAALPRLPMLLEQSAGALLGIPERVK